MTVIEKTVKMLGEPYTIKNIDGEDCIYRKLEQYEFEVSGISQKFFDLYVWTISPRKVVGIYTGISSATIKDTLGYYAFRYQNLQNQIRVEREEIRV